MQTELGLRCSGALIGPRLVLTAAHCLLGPNTGRPVRPGSVHVLSGYAAGHYAGHARGAALRLGPGAGRAAPDADWALVELDAPIGEGRTLKLAPSTPPPGTPVMLGGYEQDRAEIMLADTACTLTGALAGSLLQHDCAATRGSSGAPLLARDPTLGWVVIGIASRAALGRRGGLAVPITAVPITSVPVAAIKE